MTNPRKSPATTAAASAGVATLVALAAFTSTQAGAQPRAQSWGISDTAPASAPRRPTSTPTTTIDKDAFRHAIERVVNMPFDNDLNERARRRGLDIVNVMWEDTGRDVGSSMGPNISDLTLQVREPLGRDGTRTHLLPVLRYPNYSDTTADVRLDKIWVPVGNQINKSKTVTVPLSEVLKNLKSYLSDPRDLPGSANFLASRDTHVLVSAQHVFMPLPKTGKAEFTPVLYNYQSSVGAPAVLSLLVTRQGTSISVIENWSGDQSYQQWGQQLYYNNKGQRTTFTAERRSSVESRVNSGSGSSDDKKALAKGADMVLIIQVPLEVARPMPMPMPAPGVDYETQDSATKAAGAAPQAASESARSDVETAVIGHGEDSGPFHEIGGLSIKRDTRFPIRMTVQFYKATSNGVVSDADLTNAKSQIDEVYRNGDYVGSLVLPEGNHSRPTDWVKGRTPYKP